MREAWRGDQFSGDTEDTAFAQFGALLSAGDFKARMDMLLYGSDGAEAGLRSARRLGAGYVALAKAKIALNRKGSNVKALLDANPAPTIDQIRFAIAGNICRCTGYTKILDAIALAAQPAAQESTQEAAR